MILRIKKRSLLFLVLVIVLFISVMFSLDSEVVVAACSDSDNFSLLLHDPSGVLIGNATGIISPVAGVECNGATTTDVALSVSCQIAGNYTANISMMITANHTANITSTTVLFCHAPNVNKFIIRNSSSDNVAAFDEKGFVYLRGNNLTGQTSMSPPPNSYIIKNNTKVVAYINSTGDLHLAGTIFKNQDSISPPPNSFVIQNKTGLTVAYINTSGDLVMTGVIYHNWTDPI